MIRRIEAWHYRSLKKIGVRLEPVNILIGPNASGKSTFLDVFSFLRDALEDDVESAVRKRGDTLAEMVWNQENVPAGFEIAIEVDIPAFQPASNGYNRLRYEVGVGLDDESSICVTGENLWLVDTSKALPEKLSQPRLPGLFPIDSEDDKPILLSRSPTGYKLVVRKVHGGNDYFRAENSGWNITFRLDPKRLALSGVPADLDRFPVALWFRQFLNNDIQPLQLNSARMREPAPYDAPKTFQLDGSNLPIMVEILQNDPTRFGWWIGHLQTALPDIQSVEVEERPQNRSRYLVVTYQSGLRVPAWFLSDGTVRLLALTLIAYLPPREEIFLIEEPENGMHPKAVEAVFEALTSVYDSQVLLATHSPLLLSLAEPDQLLIFAKTASGATDVVRGQTHPLLARWQQEVPLENLFAAGVLG